jgi:predicted RNA-binding Zn-ribbon protein involved in translation (DUF1610 family)
VSEESSRAAALLREYLASRDVRCEGCGYNLRGAREVFCPECGVVIPSPPTEYLERKRAEAAKLRLVCGDCGYTIAGVNAERCPECGETDLHRYSGEVPARFRRRRFRSPVPVLLLINAVLGLCVAFPCIALAAGRWFGSRSRIGRGDPYIGAAAALAAVGIALLWFWYRKPLARLQVGERRTLALVSFLAGLGLIALGLRAIS